MQLTKKSVVMQRTPASLTGYGHYWHIPSPYNGSSPSLLLWTMGNRPWDHFALRLGGPFNIEVRAGLSAQPTCSLERRSMPTIPRQRLVRFADYKQKG